MRFPMCKIPPLANASGILHIGGGLHPQMRRHPTFVGLRHICRFAKLLHLQTSFAFRNFANPPPLGDTRKRIPNTKGKPDKRSLLKILTQSKHKLNNVNYKMDKFLKSFVLIFMQFVLSTSVYAQKDVTQFLGIPVDGHKSEMIKKLKGKGFTISPYNKDVLVGEFNGTDVNIHIATNNNKVCRIMVSDANTMDEASIRIRFNKLCQQFQDNKKYMSLATSDYEIPENEDISYEITVKNKQYDALFYQQPAELDSTTIAKEFQDFLSTKYTIKELSNLTEEDVQKEAARYALDKTTKKAVWFRIFKYSYGKYYISMYYDNEYNRASGEDL